MTDKQKATQSRNQASTKTNMSRNCSTFGKTYNSQYLD